MRRVLTTLMILLVVLVAGWMAVLHWRVWG